MIAGEGGFLQSIAGSSGKPKSNTVELGAECEEAAKRQVIGDYSSLILFTVGNALWQQKALISLNTTLRIPV